MVGNASGSTNNDLLHVMFDHFHRRKLAVTLAWECVLSLAIGLWLLLSGCQKSDPQMSPAIVEGASMAPHFWGEHWRVDCPDCGFSFSYDLTLPKSNRLVCPNCGFREIVGDSGTRQPARHYNVEELSARKLARWDVVAIQSAESKPSGLLIKRIIGLPGETISFLHGDVLVNGQATVANWPEIDEQKMQVYDSMFDPISLPQQRLKFLPNEDWKKTSEDWQILDATVTYAKARSIEYAPWRCYLHADSREATGPIEDVYPADQALARQLHVTDQLSIVINVEVGRETEFSVYRNFCGHHLEIVFSWSNEFVAVIDHDSTEPAKEIAHFSLPREFPEFPIAIEIATFDQMLAVRIDNEKLGRIHISQMYRPVLNDVFRSTVRNGGAFKFRRLRIFRDIYWFDEPHAFAADGKATREFQVPAGQYFVMGDNVPVSRDSRDWTEPFVPRENILGRVRKAAE